MQDDESAAESPGERDSWEQTGTGPIAPGWITELIREHYTPALRYAARLLRDTVEAEDCVQEAFAEAFSNLGSLRDRGAAAAWLRSIVRHRCSRRWRRRELELLSRGEVDEGQGWTGGGRVEAWPRHALPRGAMNRDAVNRGALNRDEREGEERIARLGLARLLVASLPRHEREIVVLFYVKECSQREIASFLGLPPSTVNNRLHDARERMKQWERNMETTRIELSADADRASRVGTIVSAKGPFVEARFEPGAPFELFDALAVMGEDGACVERLKVSHWAGDGRVLCLPTGKGGAPLEVGASVLNTGKVGLERTRFGVVRGVSAADLEAAAAALGGTGPRVFQPTGIKAVDLLCPLPARGVVAQAGTGGVGRMVLLDEIAQRLARADTAIGWLCLVDRSEPDSYRGWDETALWSKSSGLGFYWALSDQGTDPECAALDACDAALYLSPLLAVQGRYPALDPEHSRSSLLRPEVVGAEHCAVAARVRQELLFLKQACADPVVLELLAARAVAAARRRVKALEEREAREAAVPDAGAVRVGRARKLQLFLTQPFAVASDVTGWPGVDVSVAQTLEGCRAILDGAVDDLPEGAFAYAGSLDAVRRHAREGVARRYGR